MRTSVTEASMVWKGQPVSAMQTPKYKTIRCKWMNLLLPSGYLILLVDIMLDKLRTNHIISHFGSNALNANH